MFLNNVLDFFFCRQLKVSVNVARTWTVRLQVLDFARDVRKKAFQSRRDWPGKNSFAKNTLPFLAQLSPCRAGRLLGISGEAGPAFWFAVQTVDRRRWFLSDRMELVVIFCCSYDNANGLLRRIVQSCHSAARKKCIDRSMLAVPTNRSSTSFIPHDSLGLSCLSKPSQPLSDRRSIDRSPTGYRQRCRVNTNERTIR